MRVRARPSRLPWVFPLLLMGAGVVACSFYFARTVDDPDRVWEQAELDLKSHRLDQAERGLARLSRLRPPTPFDRMLRAQVAMSRDRTDEALRALARIPSRNPLAGQARLLSGQLELRRNRIRAAEAFYLEALALDPRLVQAHRELIYIYGLQLRRHPLGEQFRALSELTPLTFDNVFHWCLTRNVEWDPKEVVETMTRWLGTDPNDRASRLALADSLRLLGRLDEAEQTLKPLPDSDPDARAARVLVALARGDETTADSLLNGGPDDHPALARLRGQFAIAHRDAKAALHHFRAAYRVEPDDRESVFGLASALILAGEREKATPYLEQARAHDRLGTLMQRVMIAQNQKDPRILRDLGAACEAIRRLPEARAWYNLAIGLDPFDREAQQALSRVDAALAKSATGAAGA